MDAGTIVRLPDGREGTVVYNGLDGVGIRWGRHEMSREDVDAIYEGDGNCTRKRPSPATLAWLPDAMLRDPYPSASIECVGEDYEVVA